MFLQNQYLAMKICDIFNLSVRNKLTDKKNLVKGAEFPTTSTIYVKELVIEADPKNKKNKKYENDENIINKENTYVTDKNEHNIDSEKKEQKIFKEDLKNLLNNKEKNKNLDKLNNGSTIPTSNNLNNFLSTSKINETTSASNSNSNLSSDTNINCEKIEKKLERNNSDYSNSSEMTFSTDNSKDKKKNSIFKKKFKSRFGFPDDENKEDAILVPDYISEIISFKTSTYFYLNKIDLNEYINKKYKTNMEDWHKLLMLNKSMLIEN